MALRRASASPRDLNLLARFRGQLDHGAVGSGADALRGLAAAGDLVGGLALALGAHPGIGRVQVLLGQVGAGQAHVDDAHAQILGIGPRKVADAVHQRRAVIRQHRGRGDRPST